MSELFTTAIAGANIIPTTLLALVILYWLIVIVGAIDIEFLDIDIDVDADGDVDMLEGPFHGILAFLNIAELPFMLVFSIIVLIFWTISMLLYFLPIKTGGVLNGILLIPTFIISLLLTRVVTNPLKGLFAGVQRENDEGSQIEGKLGTLLSDLTYGRLGQAELERYGAPIIINVKLQEEESLKKGAKVLIIKKDSSKDYYIIKKFEGVR